MEQDEEHRKSPARATGSARRRVALATAAIMLAALGPGVGPALAAPTHLRLRRSRYSAVASSLTLGGSNRPSPVAAGGESDKQVVQTRSSATGEGSNTGPDRWWLGWAGGLRTSELSAGMRARPLVSPTPVPSCPASGATTWTGSAGAGAWETAGNWSAGVPTSSLYACVPAGSASLTVNSGAVAAGLLLGGGDSLHVQTGSLSLGPGATDSALQGALTVEADVAVTVAAGSTLIDATGGSITNLGSFAVQGGFEQQSGSVATATGDNPVDMQNGSSLILSGAGPGAFEVFDSRNNGPTVSLSGDLAHGQSLAIYAEALWEYAGSFDATGTTVVNATASFSNAGTITFAHTGSMPSNSSVLNLPTGSTLTNTGTISVSGNPDEGAYGGPNNGPAPNQTNQTIDFVTATGALGTGSIENQGTLDVGMLGQPAAFLVFPAGTSFVNTGRLDIASTTTDSYTSTLYVSDRAVFDNASGSVTDLGALAVQGGFEQLGGTIATAAGDNPVDMQDGSSLAFSGTGPGAFEAFDPYAYDVNPTVSLSGDLAKGQSLAIDGEDICCNSGTPAFGTTTVRAAGSFTNAGTITFQEVTNHSGTTGGAELLTLPSGDTLTNSGTISVSGDPQQGSLSQFNTEIDANLVNSGTLNVGVAAEPAGFLVLASGDTFTNSGSVDVASAASSSDGLASVVLVQGSVLNQAGIMTVDGTFEEGAVGTAQGSFVEEAGVTKDGPVQLDSGSLSFQGGGAAAFQVPPGASIQMSGNMAAGQSVTIEDNSNTVCGGTLASADAGFTNAGTISLQSGCGPAELTVAGTLTNTGAISFAGTGGARELDATLDNQATGTISVAGGGTATLKQTTTNNGTITVTAGELYLAGGLTNLNAATGTLTGGTYKVLGAALPPGGVGPTTPGTIAIPHTGIDAIAASVELGPGGSFVDPTNNNGPSLDLCKVDTGGSLTLDAGTTLQASGCAITNNGQPVGAGPTDNAGTITVAGTAQLSADHGYTQESTGTLAVVSSDDEVGARLVSQLGASIRLAGTLDILATPGFSPSKDQGFQVVVVTDCGTCLPNPISGTFDQVNGAIIGNGLVYAVGYGPPPPFGSSDTLGPQVWIAAEPGVQDLAAKSVSGPTRAQIGQSINVSWTAEATSGNVTGPWVDAVYLSGSRYSTTGAVLLGTVAHSTSLESGQIYTANLTATVPAVIPEMVNYLVVVIDAGAQVPDPTRSDNLASTSFEISMPTLAVGGTTSGTPGPYFQISAPAGSNFMITATYNTSYVEPVLTVSRLYESFGRIPGPGSYDEDSVVYGYTPNSATTEVTITNAQLGPYFVDLGPDSLATSWTISVSEVSFGISSLSPATATILNYETCESWISVGDGPPEGQGCTATSGWEPDFNTTISGVGFTPATTAELDCGGLSPLAPRALTYVSSTELYVDFPNLGGQGGFATPSGSSCNVAVEDHGQTAQLADGVTIRTVGSILGAPPPLPDVSLVAPSINRPGEDATLFITYSNPFTYEIPAPLMELNATGATLHFPDQPVGDNSTLLVLGVAPAGNPGVLAPGQSGSVSVVFDSTLGAHQNVNFGLDLMSNPQGTVDLGGLLASMLPAGIAASVSAYVAAQGGKITGAQLQSILDADATYLAILGERVTDIFTLLGFELNKITDYGALVVDHTAGPLGPGLPPLVDHAGADPAGNVTVTDPGGHTVIFPKLPAGGYGAPPGVFSTLAAGTAGGWVMAQPDGTKDTFDSSGDLVSSTDPYGNVTGFSYANGNLSSVTGPSGDAISYTYNAAGKLTSTTDGTTGRVVDYGYDSTGRMTSISSDGATLRMAWNETATNPGIGPAQDGTLASLTPADGVVTSFSYDTLGRLTQIQQAGTTLESLVYNPNGSVASTDAEGKTTTDFPNEAGVVLRSILPNGELADIALNSLGEPTSTTVGTTTNLYGYDSSGDLTSLTNSLGQSLFLQYAGIGALSGITQPSGAQTSWALNAEGDPTALTFPNGASESLTYSPAGLITGVTDRGNQSLGFAYDASDLPVTETLPGGSQASFTYDSHRNLTSATNASGTTKFTYDSDNRLTSVTYPTGLGIYYAYDQAGRRARMSTSDGYEVAYHYDGAGHLASISDASGNTVAAYAYTPDGQLALVTNANRTTTTYTYDDLGNIASVTNKDPSGAVTSSFTYTRNGLGEATSVVDAQHQITSYRYDAAGELVSASLPGGRTLAYTYDADGNLTQVVDSAIGTTAYTVNSQDEYAQAGATNYTYDADGNLTSATDASGNTTAYTWDALGRLTAVSGPSGATTYAYDALGTPISETTGATTTDFLSDPLANDFLVGQYSSTGSVIAHYGLGMGLAARSDPSGTSSYGFDGSGNVVSVSGPSGTVTDTYSYLPYGSPASSPTGTTVNPFRFEGQFGLIQQPTAGLYRAGVRFYDPGTGRFISQDSKLASAPNPYQYAANDPIDKVDTTGQDWADIANNISTYAGFTTSAVENVAQGVYDSAAAIARGIGSGVSDIEGPALDVVDSSNYAGGVLSLVGAGTTLYSGTQKYNNELANHHFNQANTTLYNTTVDTVGGVVLAGGVLLSAPISLTAGVAVYAAQRIRDSGLDSKLGADFWDWYYTTPWLNPSPFAPDVFGYTANYYSETRMSHDPNDMIGPAGYGSSGFVKAGATMPYQVDFANCVSTVSGCSGSGLLPVQAMTISEVLDPNLDLSTFSLGSFGFAGHTVVPPPGQSSYATTIDDTAVSGLDVHVVATLDPASRTVTWMFSSIDPRTGAPPTSASAGFLPPDTNPPEGEGFVSYTVRSLSSAKTGTQISAQASVVFDTNAPLSTATVTNTLDAGAPTASVKPLPATTTSPFTLSWSGTDDSGGSGIAFYNVWYADDGGPMTPLEVATTATSTTFQGAVGHTYVFAVQATDNVGNAQAIPGGPQAVTTVVAPNGPGTATTTDFSDPPGTLPTSTNPLVVTVVDPVGGAISITKSGKGTAVSGYSLLGASAQISAAGASEASPIQIVFALSTSLVPPGVLAHQVVVFKDGVAVPSCAGGTASAQPDPCVASALLTGSVLSISVLTSTASTWSFATPLAFRVAGPTRIGTAVAASQQAFPVQGSARAVVLARDDAFPDALAGTPLAVDRHGPVLLTEGAGLDPATAAEISRVLDPGGTVYLLGGDAALAPGVATAVARLGYNVVRYGGADRYGTAVAVAQALGNPAKILLADGTNFPDALSAGAAAGATGAAVLLSAGSSLAAATSGYLHVHPADQVTAVGGPAAHADPAAIPVVGADRYATAAMVANRYFPNPAAAGVASGLNFPDALAGGAELGALSGPMLLTDPNTLSPSAEAYLKGHTSGLRAILVYGGAAAIANPVERATGANISTRVSRRAKSPSPRLRVGGSPSWTASTSPPSPWHRR